MAEERLELPVNGMSVQKTDVDLWSKNAALADDRVLAELVRLRPKPSGPGVAARAILPSGTHDGSISSSILVPSGSSDSTVKVRPFRAIIGSRDTIDNIGHKDNWQDVRSALHIPNVDDEQYRNIQLSATTSNNRWDLIWARVDVDIDSATVSRYVKSSSGTVSAQNVVPTKVCTVTIGVTEGTEASTPSVPSLPSDSGSAYYIRLGSVLLAHPHTLTDAIAADQIREDAPIVSLAEAMGATTVSPPQAASAINGYPQTLDPWTTSTRSALYLPSTMVGGLSRFFPVQGLTVGTHILDASADWRNRLFKVHLNRSNGTFPGAMATSDVHMTVMGQTLKGFPTNLLIARLIPDDSGSGGAKILTASSGQQLDIMADSSGFLVASASGGTISANVVVWLEATGAWGNYS